MSVLLMWSIGLYPLNFFLIKCVFIIWVFFIVLCKIGSCLTCCYSFLKVLNQKLNLKFQQMDFWFEFLDIHMNEEMITCHDCNGFKWQNINIYPILIVFLCSPTSFLIRCIVIAPILFTIAYNYPSILIFSYKSLLLMWI
jgi:hypothetical protein